MACAVVFLLACRWVPISVAVAEESGRVEQPLALAQVEAALEEIAKAEMVEPPAIEALQQKLQSLQNQPPESWYSQSSLEAAAALREETGQAIGALGRNLSTVESLLADSRGTPTQGEPLERWNAALQALQAGKLPLTADMRKLFSESSKLSEAQRQALEKKLCEQCGACQSAMNQLGQSGRNLSLGMALIDLGMKLQEGQEVPASGGPSGGGPPAQLGFKNETKDIQLPNTDGIASSDVENLSPGDVIEVTVGHHETEPASGAPQTGGAASDGSGGDAVWQHTATPKEEAVLRRYFR